MKSSTSPKMTITMAGMNPIGDTLAAINAEGWRQNVKEKTSRLISANERTSISALIAYISMQSGESEFRIERRLADRFNVANVLCLPTEQFDNAIRYLVDALPKGIEI